MNIRVFAPTAMFLVGCIHTPEEFPTETKTPLTYRQTTKLEETDSVRRFSAKIDGNSVSVYLRDDMSCTTVTTTPVVSIKETVREANKTAQAINVVSFIAMAGVGSVALVSPCRGFRDRDEEWACSAESNEQTQMAGAAIIGGSVLPALAFIANAIAAKNDAPKHTEAQPLVERSKPQACHSTPVSDNIILNVGEEKIPLVTDNSGKAEYDLRAVTPTRSLLQKPNMFVSYEGHLPLILTPSPELLATWTSRIEAQENEDLGKREEYMAQQRRRQEEENKERDRQAKACREFATKYCRNQTQTNCAPVRKCKYVNGSNVCWDDNKCSTSTNYVCSQATPIACRN